MLIHVIEVLLGVAAGYFLQPQIKWAVDKIKSLIVRKKK